MRERATKREMREREEEINERETERKRETKSVRL